MKRICLILAVLGILLFPMMLFAQTAEATSVPQPVTLGTRIIIFAGVVAAIVQGIKRAFPAISGVYAVALNTFLSVALTYAAAPAGSVVSVGFFLTTIGAIVGSTGIHAFLTGGNQLDTVK